MKVWMKSGLCLALGCLASRTEAQEINWRPAVPHNSNIAVVAPARGTVDTGVRPVGLSRPVPIGTNDTGSSLPAFRPMLDRPTPIVRGQAPDERLLGKGVGDPNPSKTPAPRPSPIIGETPRPMPAPEFIAPQPQPAAPLTVSPYPGNPGNPGSIWGGVGGVNMNNILGINGGGIDDCNACASCGVGSCSTDCCLPRPLRFWVAGEYLMWWTRSQSVPPLVTGSPTTNTSANAGKLGDPGTSILYNSVENAMRSGARFSAGFWFPCCDWGMDASYFFLGRQVTNNTFGNQPGLGVYRPYTDANTGNQAIEQVNTGAVTGTVNVNTFSELWGGDINLRRKLTCGPTYWLDGIVGYRHLELNEGVTITENLIVNNNNVPGSIIVSDSFRTYNKFDGAQIGLIGEYRFASRWSLFGTMKLAMGNVHQTVDMQGSTSFNIPPIAPSVQPGGLLVQNSNIGRYSVDRFAVMPEVGIKIGWDLTDRLRLYAGYDFMYLSSVIRPGDQIDTRLDPGQLPTALGPGRVSTINQPAVLFRTTDFWAQGLNFGMMYRY